MKTKVVLFVIMMVAFTFGCTNSNNDQVVVNATQSIGENLDLKAVGEIVKNSKKKFMKSLLKSLNSNL